MERPLIEDCEVWVTSGQEAVRGRVVASAPTLRSYLIDTPSSIIRRNQQHLRTVPGTSTSKCLKPVAHNCLQIRGSNRGSTISTRSQTGTAIVPPLRYQTLKGRCVGFGLTVYNIIYIL